MAFNIGSPDLSFARSGRGSHHQKSLFLPPDPSESSVTTSFTIDESDFVGPILDPRWGFKINNLHPFPYFFLDLQQVIPSIYLLKWIPYVSSNESTYEEDYNRLYHFGNWIRDSNDSNNFDSINEFNRSSGFSDFSGSRNKFEDRKGRRVRKGHGVHNCNTRDKILIMTSQTMVQFKSPNRCTVSSGQWYDPYTDRYFYEAKDLQIDHLVPLKNAYLSGARYWDREKRCAYANFQGDQFHLIPIFSRENSRKGDSGPDKYIPPNTKFTCEYLLDWLRVKLVWQLRLNWREAHGILQRIQEAHCNQTLFFFSSDALIRERQSLLRDYPHCQKESLDQKEPYH